MRKTTTVRNRISDNPVSYISNASQPCPLVPVALNRPSDFTLIPIPKVKGTSPQMAVKKQLLQPLEMDFFEVSHTERKINFIRFDNDISKNFFDWIC